MKYLAIVVVYCVLVGCGPRAVTGCAQSDISKIAVDTKRRLVDLKDGETAYIQYVYITSDGRAFIPPDSVLTSRTEFHEGIITRKGDAFCVRIGKLFPLDHEPLPNYIRVGIERDGAE